MRILAISGSLRRGSYNGALLEAAAAECPADVEFVVWRGLADLPAFDEDLETAPEPLSVATLKGEIARSDAVLISTPEYNASVPGALKNALDQSYKEWNRKPFTAIGYGGVGAARAIEHLRQIAIELQMVSTHASVNIGGGDYMAVHPMFGKKPIEDIEANLLPAAKTALDDLAWWARATMAARAAEAA